MLQSSATSTKTRSYWMPDVEWIMENCHMMRDNGVWGG